MSSRTKSLIATFFILILDNLGYAVALPLFPVLLLNPPFFLLNPAVQEMARHIYLALLIAAFPLGQFFGALFFGELADRFGRKKILLWTISGTLVGYLLSGLALTYSSYPLLFLSRLMTGFFAGNLAVCLAIIADMHFGKKSRSRNFGYVAASLGISWMAGIWGGSALAHPALLFWALALLSCLGWFILRVFFRETLVLKNNGHIHLIKGIHRILNVLENKQMRTLLLILAIWFFGFFIAVQWAIPISIDKFHAGAPLVLKLLLTLGLFWTFGSLLNAWVSGYFSSWKIEVWSLFCIGLLYFFGAVTDFFLYFALALLLSGLFAAFAASSNVSLISLAASQEDQGKSLGIAAAIIALIQCLGPIFGGFIAGFSLETLFFSSSLFILCSFLTLLVYILRRKTKLLNNQN
ncbi:MFS transporter [Chlamydiota bacterium]